MGTLTNQIADELEAKTIGKSSSSVVENKQVTKSKAVSLGCTVKGTYKDNQCTKYSDLSATIAPTQYTIGLRGDQQNTSPAIKVKLTPSGSSATTITGSQTLKIASGTTVSISITRDNHTLTSWDLICGDTTIPKGTATSFTMPNGNCVIYTRWQSNSGGTGSTGSTGGGGGGGGTVDYGEFADDYYGSEYRNDSAKNTVVLGQLSLDAYTYNYNEYPNTNDDLPYETEMDTQADVETYDSLHGLSDQLTYCISKKDSAYEFGPLYVPFIRNDSTYSALKGMGIYGATIQECNSTPYASALSAMYPGNVNEAFFCNDLQDIRYVVFTHPNAPSDRTCFKYRVFENPYYHFKYTCMPNESTIDYGVGVSTGLGCYECYPDESMTTLLPITDATEDTTGGALMLYTWDTAPVLILDKGSLPDTKLPYKYLAQIRVDFCGTIDSFSAIEEDTATPWFYGSSLEGYDYEIPEGATVNKGAYSNLTLEHGDILLSHNVIYLLEFCRHISIGVSLSDLIGIQGIGIEIPNYTDIHFPDFGFAYRFVLCLVNKEVQSDAKGAIIGILHCDQCQYGDNSLHLNDMYCQYQYNGNQYIIFTGQDNGSFLENYDGNGYTESSTSDTAAQELEEMLNGFRSNPDLNYQWSLYCEIIDISRSLTYSRVSTQANDDSGAISDDKDLGNQEVITGFRIDFNSDMTLSTLHIIWQHDIYSPRYE